MFKVSYDGRKKKVLWQEMLRHEAVSTWKLWFRLGAMLGIWCNSVFAQETHLTLLHTNDMAGRFEQILKAGAIKKQIEQTQGAVLLLDAGNTMTGFEGAFAHGAGQESPTVMFLGRAGYDALVPGQRELGLPLDLFTGFMRKAAFPVLGANLHRPQTGRFLFQVQPYALIRTGGVRVGVLGLSQASTSIWQGDPVLAAQYYVPILRQQADVLVVLSHQDYAVDSTLAVSVEGIDVIVGTYSEQASAGLREVNGVQIRQAGADGQFLGRIDLTLVGGRVTSATGQLILLEEPGPDGAEEMLADWTLPFRGEGVPVVSVLGQASGGFGEQEGGDAAMGYLLADLIRQASGAEVGLVAATSVRGNLSPGPIRALDLYRIYGRAHRVAVVRLKGEVLKAMFEAGLDRVDAFFYPSGVEILYDLDRPKGDRIVGINLETGKPLALDKTYSVAIEKEADAFKTYQTERPGDLIRDLLGRYIQEQGTIRGQVDSRYRAASKLQDGVE